MYSLFIIFDNKHLNYSLEKIFNSKVIKGGGKQYLFQEIIINNLESNISKQNFVPDLTINEQITLPKLIAKQNGVNLPFIYKKIQLNENRVYLIKQEIYISKSIDFIIIDNQKDEQKIFAFQVNFVNESIFQEDDIKKILNKMIYYLQNFFSNLKVKKENLYYGLIFSLDNIDKQEIKSIIDKCEENNVAFSYYSYRNNIFLNSYNLYIKSIYDIVKSRDEIKPILTLNFDNKKEKEMNVKQEFEMNKNTKDNLINSLRKILYKDIEDLEFKEQLNKQSLRSKYYDFYYTQDEKFNSLIFIRKVNKFEVYALEKLELKNIENSMKNEEIFFDCYFIQFKLGEKIDINNY